MAQPLIQAFLDERTNTISYLVGDPATRKAAVIDPVPDFDMASGVVQDGIPEGDRLGFALAREAIADVTVEAVCSGCAMLPPRLRR